MPNTLRLPNRGYIRRLDIEHILRRLYALQCVELVGMSNVGKSALLQLLADPDVWTQELGEAGREFFPVYVDCNRMLGLTEQGFCELVLRCLQESSTELAGLAELTAAYNTVVAPGSDFQVPLSFSRGLTAALKQTNRKIVLLLDEFDDPYINIDARVFFEPAGGAGSAQQSAGVCNGDGPAAGRACRTSRAGVSLPSCLATAAGTWRR